MSTNHYVGTERSYVPKAELYCGVQRFNVHIHIGTVQSHHPITCPDLDFRLSALLERFDELDGNDSGGLYHRAVFVHYGLDAKGEWAVALEFIKLKYDPAQDDYTFTPADTYYRPDALRLVSIGGGHDAWYGPGKPGAAYAAGLVVRHTSDPLWKAFETGTDIEATVHAYEHILEQWIKQNEGGAEEDMTVRLLPICTAAQRNSGVETGFGQSCAWVFLQAPPDDVDYGPGAEFRLKGADLGSPCPPNRLRLHFVTVGLQRSPGC